MLRIDSHQHFWNYDPARDTWINNKMQVLQKDFLPADLQPLLQEHVITGCIAVQADQSEAENEFLLSCARDNPFIKGIVGWIDLTAKQVENRLIYYQDKKIIKGFRHILQSETDRAFMLRPDFVRGIGLLSAYGFSYDLLIVPDQLLFARELALTFPEQRFILDHIAKPDIKRGGNETWAEELKILAACPNVYCKLSGLITEADWKHWSAAQVLPYIETAVAAFGMKRLMFGSDWPVCLLAGNYQSVIQLASSYFSTYTQAEQEGFWAGNAITCYNLTSIDLKPDYES
jgi:L-fuconolactonase